MAFYLLMILILLHNHSTTVNGMIVVLDSDCESSGSCLNISMLVTDTATYVTSNTTLIFPEGNHYLKSDLTISNTEYLHMSSESSTGMASIICTENAKLNFYNTTELQINGLMFVDCKVRAHHVNYLVLEDSVFDGANANGSALVLIETNTTIGRCSFVSYKAGTYQRDVQFLNDTNHPYSLLHLNSQDAHLGGAIVVTNSNLEIDTSDFINNSAEIGGALYTELGSSITVANSTFIGNRVTGCFDDRCNGGALFIDKGCSITIRNSTFENNTSDFSGGAIALFKATFTGTGNQFSHNRAINFGGCLFAHFGSKINSDSSFFIGNDAGSSGGVMYADYFSNAVLKNSTVTNNRARMSMCTPLSSTTSSSCFDNEAGFGGGALYARYSSSITIENSLFSDNKAENDGGVVYAISNSSINVESSTFDNNSARYGGGAMYAYYHSSVIISNSHFSDNSAGNTGGVCHIFYGSRIIMNGSTFHNNSAGYTGGALHVFYLSFAIIDNSTFDNNNASYFGGVIYANYLNIINVYGSNFRSNIVHADGGAIFVYDNNSITLDGSSFSRNIAGGFGGVVYASRISRIAITNGCEFFMNRANGGAVVFLRDQASVTDVGSKHSNNTANSSGGVYCINDSDVELTESTFEDNFAQHFGGVLNLIGTAKLAAVMTRNKLYNNSAMCGAAISMSANDSLMSSQNTYSFNSATAKGGVIYLKEGNRMNSDCDLFEYNTVLENGGVFYLQGRNKLTVTSSNFSFNRAEHDGGVFYALMYTKINLVGENSTFTGNKARNGGVIRVNETTIKMNATDLVMDRNTATESGGVAYLSHGILTCSGAYSNLAANQATNGGAVYALYSRLMFSGMDIANNLANGSGGGLHLISSKMQVKTSLFVSKNTAKMAGGGLHAVNTSIEIEGMIELSNNEAKNGGGASLMRRSKVYGKSVDKDTFMLTSNMAHTNGGGLYINDTSNREFCTTKQVTSTAETDHECFFSSIFFSFSENSAEISGADLFGGFLDRCIQVRDGHENQTGLESFQRSSNINETGLDRISSLPVRVCFCINGVPDCNLEPATIRVEIEKPFSVEIIAHDQVNKGVNATFDCSLKSPSGLQRDQMIQHSSPVCTKLNFNLDLFTRLGFDLLSLSVRGPCSVTGSSSRNVSIQVNCSCPLGLEGRLNDNKTSCTCVCHHVLKPYNAECDKETQSITRNDNFWISYVKQGNSSGYIIYPNCPFDYCHPPESSVIVNLNMADGSDMQCASNRTGILCGTCQPGLSVSAGNSHCIPCPSHWPWLLAIIIVVFLLLGIALVILILALKLTVATGTLNAIIFYANIVAANKSAIFKTSETTFASVIISWLNFDNGFDICVLDGMDQYVKTWSQLAFPVYIIVLVLVIIKLSNVSNTFARLIGKRDPVATLATLILLSYTNFLQIIITAFSNAVLHYPDGSTKTVWLADGTIEYIKSKHAFLFIIATLILLIGLVYTFLLFSWQWLICCKGNRVKWIRNPKINSFMRMYHIPYTPKHRYWTGLLLLFRVCIYLIPVFNSSNDPRIALLSTIFIMSILFLYIAMFGVTIYENWLVNAMEIFTYFNLTVLCLFTWYINDAGGNQDAVTNISIGIIFVQILLVLSYHVYRYANQKLFSRIQKSVVCTTFNNILTKLQPTPTRDISNKQTHELLDVVDRSVDKDDTRERTSSNLSYSVVKLFKEDTEDTKQQEVSNTDCGTREAINFNAGFGNENDNNESKNEVRAEHLFPLQTMLCIQNDNTKFEEELQKPPLDK